MAAAALTVAVSVSTSKQADSFGPDLIADPKLRSLSRLNTICFEIDGVKQKHQECPLCIWGASVRKLTQLRIESDIRPGYLKMLEIVNDQFFQG